MKSNWRTHLLWVKPNSMIKVEYQKITTGFDIYLFFPCTLPSDHWNKAHFNWQITWSCRFCWSIACRRCSNYIPIRDLAAGFNGLGKDNLFSTRREGFTFWNLVGFIQNFLGDVPIIMLTAHNLLRVIMDMHYYPFIHTFLGYFIDPSANEAVVKCRV